jgi:pyridoxal 5'-phosphate synthase pdxS subunit
VDFIDESEMLTPADDVHIEKARFDIPFVCGCRNLGEALRRINEGAAMIRTKAMRWALVLSFLVCLG